MSFDAIGGAPTGFAIFKNALKRRFGEAIYNSWMSEIEYGGVKEDAVMLSSPSDLKTDRLNHQYRHIMESQWSETVAPIKRLIIYTRREMLSENAGKAAQKVATNRRDAYAGRGAQDFALDLDAFDSPLDARLTFDAYAVDDSNAVAYAAAQRIFAPGAAREIVYVFGPSGVGKTHLLHAIGHEWRKRHPGSKCAYFTHANMRDCFAPAAMSNSLSGIHQLMLSRDLILIDDLHTLISCKRTVEEILCLINAFATSGRQVVVAGEASPLRLAEQGLNQRLADRLSGGLAAPVEPGGEQLRFEVLKKRRTLENAACQVTDEALEFCARQFPGSMREAIGAFNQLTLAYGRRDMVVGVEEARHALRAQLNDRRRRATLPELLQAAANAFGVSVADLTGRGQPQHIVRGRHAFALVGRDVMGESFPSLGKALNRDHTTVMSGYDRAQALRDRDEKFRAAIASIRTEIGL